MIIFISIRLIILILCLFFFFWLEWRNNRVYDFRIKIINLASDAARERIYAGRNDWKELHKLHNKYTYEQMMFSFKPLTLEAWFTKEEIESITPKKH